MVSKLLCYLAFQILAEQKLLKSNHRNTSDSNIAQTADEKKEIPRMKRSLAQQILQIHSVLSLFSDEIEFLLQDLTFHSPYFEKLSSKFPRWLFTSQYSELIDLYNELKGRSM